MEQPTSPILPAYPGPMTDECICAIFGGAADFVARQLEVGEWTLYAYSIDGLVSGGDISQYVFKPVAELLTAETIKDLYRQALRGTVYNAVASKCRELADLALQLVNGFCVILFPGVGAVA